MTRTVAGFQFSVLGSPKWVGFALLRDLDPRVCQDESMVGRSLMSVPPRWRKAARMAPEVGFEPTIDPDGVSRYSEKQLYERIREPWDN